jgi:hypothetical protein
MSSLIVASSGRAVRERLTEAILADIERHRDGARYRAAEWRILRRLALTACQMLHVRPGETIWELAAGAGHWTAALAEAVGNDTNVIGLVGADDLYRNIPRSATSRATFLRMPSLESMDEGRCDYIVGRSILHHANADRLWMQVMRLLKPGGRCLFFEDNIQHPLVASRDAMGRIYDTLSARPNSPAEEDDWLVRVMRAEVPGVDVRPYGLVNSCTPGRPMAWIMGVLEATPGVRWLTRTVVISGTAAGENAQTRTGALATRAEMFGSTSVVVPCRNEAANLPGLVAGLISLFDQYIHEIIIVNDNSSDETGAVAERLARSEPRVRPVHRTPPGGVGRALRDGYRAATGRYILSMDADFVSTLPELRGLFEAVANGSDGAIGSRFTPGSVLVRYPLGKLICNRAVHLILKILVDGSIRDVSNNLKLYRSEIFKRMELRSDTFAANLETGLKPILDGYNIAEVPVSWVNRTPAMGSSSFRLLAVGPYYAATLVRTLCERSPIGRRAANR